MNGSARIPLSTFGAGLALALLAALMPSPAAACSCGFPLEGNPPCAAYQAADAVFAGTVLEGSLLGEVRGTLVDGAGAVPPPGGVFLKLDPAPLELLGEPAAPKPPPAGCGILGEDGSFVFRRVAPGTYLLVANGLVAPARYPTAYYPGPGKDAELVTVAPGQRLDLGVFLLPAPLAEVRLKGKVRWPGGEPGRGLWVELEAVGHDGGTAYVQTDEAGRFAFQVFEGLDYRLAVRTVAGGPRATEPRPVSAADAGTLLVLTLPPDQ